MFRCLLVILLIPTQVFSAAKQAIQIEVEVWKNGQLDSKSGIVTREGELGSINQSSDGLSFKLNVSPKTAAYSDRAYKIALEYVEIKEGQEPVSLNANVETSSYETSVVKFLPPQEGANSIELKISAKPL